MVWDRRRIEFHPVDFNISELAAECIRIFILHAKKKGISLHLSAKDDIGAHGDPQMINTVFRNLLHNAIKYSHTGGTVEMDIRAEDGMVRVAVRDQGVGIAGDHLKGLLDPAHDHFHSAILHRFCLFDTG